MNSPVKFRAWFSFE